MTFEAFWSLVQWVLVPLAGTILWWMRQLERAHRAAEVKLEQKLDAFNNNHFGEMSRLKNDLGDFKLAVVGNYVSKAELERILDRIELAIARLGDRVETLITG